MFELASPLRTSGPPRHVARLESCTQAVKAILEDQGWLLNQVIADGGKGTGWGMCHNAMTCNPTDSLKLEIINRTDRRAPASRTRLSLVAIPAHPHRWIR